MGGAYKLNKFLVFRAWKNGSAQRLAIEKYNTEKGGRWWWSHTVYPCFKAWKQFIAVILAERKQHYIDELEAKISLLEQNVNKLSHANRSYPDRIEKLEAQLAEKDSEINGLREQLYPKQVVLEEVDVNALAI